MTTTTHSADDIIRIEQLALEDVKLRDEEAAIKERRDEIKAILRGLVSPGTTTAGDYKVIVTDPARLDAKALAAAYPVEQHPSLYKPTLDTAAVKAQFAPVALEPFMTHGTSVVTVK